MEIAKLPLEHHLGTVSLWPEVQKLFGHKTEIYCVTSTLNSQSLKQENGSMPVLVASSCRARDGDAAAIRLWRAQEGKCHQILSEGGHRSTVAALAFSPDALLLASTGKDRRLCIWKRQDDCQYALAWAKDSAHKRIIWSVDFLPWQNSRILASGSRDGTVKIWSIFASTEEGVQASVVTSFSPSFKVGGKPDSVTSLSFCPRAHFDGSALLACGLASGRVELWSVSLDDVTASPSLTLHLPAELCHNATVTKLAWKPLCATGDNNNISMTLASSSADHGCRIFEVTMRRSDK